jgi:hypothetical protein
LPASHKTLLEIDGYTIIKEPVEWHQNFLQDTTQ